MYAVRGTLLGMNIDKSQEATMAWQKEFLVKVFTFLFILIILTNGSSSEAQETPVQVPLSTNCPSAELFSDVTYESLRNQLNVTLSEKKKSLIFLDFRGLEAQIDVLANHLIEQDQLKSKEAVTILKKTISHLDQLDLLISKAKEAAKQVKENHVVPLATLTSLKSEADACNLIVSPYTEIFKVLSSLNKELNEILMISQQRVKAQKERAQNLLAKINTSDEKSNVTNQAIAEHFNFIQKHVQDVTRTFEFDPSVLQIASHK
jgi:hypothetical protein